MIPIDTLRLILFLECNFKCSYCCNEQEQFNSQFQYKTWKEIFRTLPYYENLCITGGEPFLKPELVLDVLRQAEFVGIDNVYIYTNGVLLDDVLIDILANEHTSVKCLNIGLHSLNQLKAINPRIGVDIPARFMFHDKLKEQMLAKYPDRLNEDNIHPWKMNDCNMPNEDWVVLKGDI